MEGIHMPIPNFKIPAPHTATQIVHHTTTPDQLVERIKDATIVISTTAKLTAAILDPAVSPNLQFIAQLGTGYDNIDIEVCRKRGISVCNTPGGNTDTVAEHAIALFFAIRRNVTLTHNRTLAGEWKEFGSITRYLRDGSKKPPITLREEVCGIVGYGKIGT
jgi:lactate dehydrogenase-like 2-hydroxyacid dehydrogenase